MTNRLRPKVNAHCHFLNFEFIPNSMIKLLTNYSEIVAGLASLLSEDQLKKLEPTKPRLKQFLEIYKCADIDIVIKNYLSEMEKVGIDICIPLMMDLFPAAPDSTDFNIPYSNYRTINAIGKDQITLISEQVTKYPWKIFPFVMFDPRRERSDEICIDAIVNKGFIGIKMYPALGYHPNPSQNNHPDKSFENLFTPSATAEMRMRNVYEFCKNYKVPITTHVSVGGAYSTKIGKENEEKTWLLTNVENWSNPIKKYNLKINFAHLGGDYINAAINKANQSNIWREKIIEFIKKSVDESNFGKLYADIAYHDMPLNVNYDNCAKYFKDLKVLLNDEKLKSRIIFGTDASMISHTYSEQEYLSAFSENLDLELENLIFTHNSLSFLFQEDFYDGKKVYKIPRTYVQFLQNQNQNIVPVSPAWIKKIKDDYYVIPIEED